jgi:hypothetical protein
MVTWDTIELPGFEAALSAVAPSRVQALASQLRTLVAGLAAPQPAAGRSGPEPAASGESGEFAAACATCRGHCCQRGGDIAYLNLTTLAATWNGLSHLSRDELVRAYIDAVPSLAFEGSCIFHAAHGCNLPRSMRSHICLNYLCPPLKAALFRRQGQAALN